MHRKRPLHNFALPELRWANQKFLRCKNPSAADLRREAAAAADCGGIAAVREEVMLDIKAAAETIMMPPDKDSGGGGDGSPAAARPWNLRTRRAACRAPEKTPEKSPEKKEKAAVMVAVGLSRAEIEEDFRAMAGVRPPRRPKKRNRTVQKDLDQLFPGLWLTEITPEAYKVEDAAE